MMDELNNNEKRIQNIREEINRLELESIDLHTYQSNIGQLNANDVGPAYENSSSEYNQTLSHRIDAINEKMDTLKKQLKSLED